MQGAKLVNRTSVLAWRIKKSLKPDVRIAIRNTEEKNSISQLADVDRFFGIDTRQRGCAGAWFLPLGCPTFAGKLTAAFVNWTQMIYFGSRFVNLRRRR
jgi:hypothetical protein